MHYTENECVSKIRWRFLIQSYLHPEDAFFHSSKINSILKNLLDKKDVYYRNTNCKAIHLEKLESGSVTV